LAADQRGPERDSSEVPIKDVVPKESVKLRKGFTDIMMGLGITEMRALKKEFQKNEDGLSIQQARFGAIRFLIF